MLTANELKGVFATGLKDHKVDALAADDIYKTYIGPSYAFLKRIKNGGAEITAIDIESLLLGLQTHWARIHNTDNSYENQPNQFPNSLYLAIIDCLISHKLINACYRTTTLSESIYFTRTSMPTNYNSHVNQQHDNEIERDEHDAASEAGQDDHQEPTYENADIVVANLISIEKSIFDIPTEYLYMTEMINNKQYAYDVRHLIDAMTTQGLPCLNDPRVVLINVNGLVAFIEKMRKKSKNIYDYFIEHIANAPVDIIDAILNCRNDNLDRELLFNYEHVISSLLDYLQDKKLKDNQKEIIASIIASNKKYSTYFADANYRQLPDGHLFPAQQVFSKLMLDKDGITNPNTKAIIYSPENVFDVIALLPEECRHEFFAAIYALGDTFIAKALNKKYQHIALTMLDYADKEPESFIQSHFEALKHVVALLGQTAETLAYLSKAKFENVRRAAEALRKVQPSLYPSLSPSAESLNADAGKAKPVFVRTRTYAATVMATTKSSLHHTLTENDLPILRATKALNAASCAFGYSLFSKLQTEHYFAVEPQQQMSILLYFANEHEVKMQSANIQQQAAALNTLQDPTKLKQEYMQIHAIRQQQGGNNNIPGERYWADAARLSNIGERELSSLAEKMIALVNCDITKQDLQQHIQSLSLPDMQRAMLEYNTRTTPAKS